MAKLGLVLWLAYSLSKKAEKIRTFLIGFLPHLIMAGFLMFLCLKQPDFGSAVVLLFLTFTMLFVAGAKLGYLLGASIMGAVVGVGLIFSRSYRLERYLAWLDMDKHRQDVAYQPFQSVMSFGSGGAVGLGLGRGLQVLYLPEAHTDFIAAIVGEELGFLGMLGPLRGVPLGRLARGACGALLAEDDYGSFIAFGISTMFGVQALVNLAVAMAILPTKGLTLAVRELRRVVAPGQRGGGGNLAQCLAASRRRELPALLSFQSARRARGERSGGDLGGEGAT